MWIINETHRRSAQVIPGHTICIYFNKRALIYGNLKMLFVVCVSLLLTVSLSLSLSAQL